MKRFVILALFVVVTAANAANANELLNLDELRLTTSLGVGTALPYNPDGFDRDYRPSFGALIDIGVGVKLIEISGSFDYSFFLSDLPEPDDVNIGTAMLTVKIKPLATAARPYLLAGGGYYRYWRVDHGPWESVLGYAAGAGLEIEIDDSRRVFFESRYIAGRTRERTDQNPKLANTETITMRFGLNWSFKLRGDGK